MGSGNFIVDIDDQLRRDEEERERENMCSTMWKVHRAEDIEYLNDLREKIRTLIVEYDELAARIGKAEFANIII